MRSLRLAVALIATAAAGCFHRASHGLWLGQEVIPPSGLDSVATAQWIAQQRARCPGQLRFNVDHMPTFSLDGSPVLYQSGIISVVCVRPESLPSRPSASYEASSVTPMSKE
jgi:hypothetical protein